MLHAASLQLHEGITHHLQLTLVGLADELLVRLCLLHFLLKRLNLLVVLALDFGQLVLPLVFLLQDLQRGALAQSVDLEQFLGELVELAQVVLLGHLHALEGRLVGVDELV